MFMDDNTKQTIESALGLVKTGVVEVYTKLQEAAPQLWQMALRQTVINGVECALGAVVALGLAIFLWVAAKKWIEYEDGSVFAVMIGCCSFVAFLAFTIHAINYIFNPAYWTLKDILEMLRH